MKALSIRQPWAWLLASGIKDVENRTWKLPPAIYSQRVYIHAGVSKSEMDKPTLAHILKIIPGKRGAYIMLEYDRLAFGAIIGEMTIRECVMASDSPWFEGPYGFVVAKPKLYSEPIPLKGHLGFFDVADWVVPTLARESTI